MKKTFNCYCIEYASYEKKNASKYVIADSINETPVINTNAYSDYTYYKTLEEARSEFEKIKSRSKHTYNADSTNGYILSETIISYNEDELSYEYEFIDGIPSDSNDLTEFVRYECEVEDTCTIDEWNYLKYVAQNN